MMAHHTVQRARIKRVYLFWKMVAVGYIGVPWDEGLTCAGAESYQWSKWAMRKYSLGRNLTHHSLSPLNHLLWEVIIKEWRLKG